MFESSAEAWEWARAHPASKPAPINSSDTAWEVKVNRWPKHTHYALASFVTAYSRIRWHQGAVLCGRVAYGDTDSLHFDRERVGPAPVGNGLGDWACKRPSFSGRYYAPKLYSMELPDGEKVYASKGFPVSAAAFARIVEGERVGNPKGRMQLVKTQLKRDAPVRHLTEAETAKQWYGHSVKRFAIPGHPEGETEAWDVRDLHEGLHAKQNSPLAPKHRPQ